MSAILIASLIGAGLSATATGVGAAQASKERSKASDLQRKREKEAKMFYNKEYNKDYFDTATAKGLLNRASVKMRDFGRQNQNSAIKTGATQENKIANAESANANYSNLLSNIADQGTTYKQNIRNQYLGQQGRLDNMAFNNIEANAQSKANAASNVGKAIGGLTQATILGSNQSKSTTPTMMPEAGDQIMHDEQNLAYNPYDENNLIIGGNKYV